MQSRRYYKNNVNLEPSWHNCSPIEQRTLTAESERASVRETELYKLMRPLMIYMELSGLFHEWTSNADADDEVSNSSKWKKIIRYCKHLLCGLWSLYPLGNIGIVMILAFSILPWFLGNVIRLKFVAVFLEIGTILFVIQNLLSILVMYFNCRSRSLLRVFQQYSMLITDNSEEKERLNKVVIQTSRIFFVLCVVCQLFLCLAYEVFFYVTYNLESGTPGCYGEAWFTLFKWKPIYIYWATICAVLISSQYALMVGFSCVLFGAMKEAFEIVNDRMEKIVRVRAHKKKDFSMWSLMAQHYRITQMLKTCSELLGSYVVTYMLLFLAYSSFVAYGSMFMCNYVPVSTVAYGTSIIIILMAFILNRAAVEVHTSATKSLEHIHHLKLECISVRHGLHLATFLRRMSSRRLIAVSAMGFCMFTPGTPAQTIIGSVISYVVVMATLSPPVDFCLPINATCTR